MKNTATTSVFALFLMCLSFSLIQAQSENQTSVSNQNLIKNFLTLTESASTYQNFKVIDKMKIANFQSNLVDYLKQEQNSKNEIVNQLQQKSSTISTLQNQISALESSNANLASGLNSIGFLGMAINKTVYSVVMWMLVLGSIAFSGILFLKFKRANEITQSSKSVLKDLEDEYESFRRVCIQREQDLKRKLYDEMKKSNNLRNAS
jgi:tetrahydromethanopterin S-methyltransferase subunit F